MYLLDPLDGLDDWAWHMLDPLHGVHPRHMPDDFLDLGHWYVNMPDDFLHVGHLDELLDGVDLRDVHLLNALLEHDLGHMDHPLLHYWPRYMNDALLRVDHWHFNDALLDLNLPCRRYHVWHFDLLGNGVDNFFLSIAEASHRHRHSRRYSVTVTGCWVTGCWVTGCWSSVAEAAHWSSVTVHGDRIRLRRSRGRQEN